MLGLFDASPSTTCTKNRALMTPHFDAMFNNLLAADPSETVNGIPIFSKRTLADRENDPYDRDDVEATLYTGLAFGFQLLMHKGRVGFGGTEGLYRTVSSFAAMALRSDAEQCILDLGCGVGRTIYDCAPRYPHSLFVGMDHAYTMCRRAKEILIEGLPISLDGPKGCNSDKYWAGRGFPNMVFANSLTLENVRIVQGSATRLPFKDNLFDCVISTFMLDRVQDLSLPAPNDILMAISEMARVMKAGGRLILSTPMNFTRLRDWAQISSADGLVQAIEEAGISIREKFDGLPYREIQDSRGNYHEWLSLVVSGEKQ